MRFRVAGGEWLTPDTADVLDHRQTVHLDSGVLERRTHFALGRGRVLSVRQLRLVHMARSPSRRDAHGVTVDSVHGETWTWRRPSTAGVTSSGVPLPGPGGRPPRPTCTLAAPMTARSGCAAATPHLGHPGRPGGPRDGRRAGHPGTGTPAGHASATPCGRHRRPHRHRRQGGGSAHLTRPGDQRPAAGRRRPGGPTPPASTNCWCRTGRPGASCGAAPNSRYPARRAAFCACTSSTCCRPSPRTPPTSDVGVPARGLHGEAYPGACLLGRAVRPAPTSTCTSPGVPGPAPLPAPPPRK
ncbi:hypothetical protein LV779_08720 [Streptomyces thinghirensis]|nr:hypothetical protein [Streptomyces thinghirensis]